MGTTLFLRQNRHPNQEKTPLRYALQCYSSDLATTVSGKSKKLSTKSGKDSPKGIADERCVKREQRKLTYYAEPEQRQRSYCIASYNETGMWTICRKKC